MTFLDLPEDTTTFSADYENAVRAAFEHLEHSWQTLAFDDGAEIEVSFAPVVLDGVYINATAQFQIEIGNYLGGELLTPEQSDLIFARADLKIPPSPHPTSGTPPMSYVKAMVEHSDTVRELVADVAPNPIERRWSGYVPPRRTFADAGKDWVRTATNMHEANIGNYGWHTTSWTTLSKYPSSSLDLWVVQPFYTGHGMVHSDYSQNVRFSRTPSSRTPRKTHPMTTDGG